MNNTLSPLALLQDDELSRYLRRLRYNLKAVPLTFHSSEWANWKVFNEELDKKEKYAPPFAKENRS